jgi:hypothetical protein
MRSDTSRECINIPLQYLTRSAAAHTNHYEKSSGGAAMTNFRLPLEFGVIFESTMRSCFRLRVVLDDSTTKV